MFRRITYPFPSFICVILSSLALACSPEAPKEKASIPVKTEMPVFHFTQDSAQREQLTLPHAWLEKLNFSLDSLLNLWESDEAIQAIAVHYCDLNTNTRITFHPEQKFIPASLLKVPTLVGLLKLVEEKKGSLSDQVDVPFVQDPTYTAGWAENQVYTLWQNRRYKLAELLDIMIRYSDNRATLAILYYIDSKSPGFLEETESQLQASIPRTASNTEDIILVSHLSGIFNALYHANFLNSEDSEFALKLLSNSQYALGFRKVIPASVPLAHKHGIRVNQSVQASAFPIQLHETGIVYTSGKPFILSVMTKGNDIEKQRKVLQDFASLCYQIQLNQ